MADAKAPGRDVIAELRTVDTSVKADQAVRYKRALAMYNGAQDAITRSELQRRYPSAFEAAGAGQEMLPVSIPLTKRFVIEQAGAYRRPPRRYFCEADGTETDATREQTDNLKRMLDDAMFDSMRMEHERLSVLFGSIGEWWGAKNKRLKVARVLPQHLLPVIKSGFGVDQMDPEDHLGYVVEIVTGRKTTQENIHEFAYITPEADYYYRAESPDKPQPVEHTEPSPFDMGEAHNKHRVTLLCDHGGGDTFIPNNDVSVAEINVELNVSMSAIIDTLRFQGHSIPVKKLTSPGNPKAMQRNGVRFPVVLSITESFDLVSSATNYTDQVNVLREIVRMMAVAANLPPSDVSTEAPSPQSGFAKLVESLPKLQAREDRIMKLTAHERMCDRPRFLAIGTLLGYLDESARKMDYRVEFPEVEYPRTEQERTQRIETDVKHGIRSAAEIVAKERGITLEQAEEIVQENTDNAPSQPQPQQPQGFGSMGFGQRIARTKREEMKREEPMKMDDK